MRGNVLAGLLVAALIAGALIVARPWTWCPAGWTDAPRITLTASAGDVQLEGKSYRVGGSASLDYMPRGFANPFEAWLYYGLHGERHPLGLTASIEATSRDELGNPEFTCFRATRGAEVWARRPTTYATQTMADGYPPGAPSPVPNQAWRMAHAGDGPEWPAGEQISLELWMSVSGRHYVFVLPPFELMKGF